MLKIDAVDAYYDKNQVLFGTSLEVGRGEVIALMGRNGMGKTTTINNVVGLIRPRSGSILFEGRALNHLPLVATAANYGGMQHQWTLDRVFELFPQLVARRNNMGNQLSGGEQQMLAIGRALMLCPKLLILDEATEGLAPIIREKIWPCLDNLKRLGLSILLIDKNLDELAPLADRTYIMKKGCIVWTGDTKVLTGATDLRLRYLGV
jgi:branched-chain amino acid transport system ATP-binding protein